ncbi:hypothetical protein DIT71_16955 [Marinobacter vulgaris]|uniref:Sulfotransferase domain-containing protein n=1 Tax=Marinobacter vulgaris TaxID=1928331 RepID=A0A2V3ZF92_9GAMM|nr:hypothetical protein [Marinobacter vulgaris]PXX88878.1 hypothetical protein DIT71_16955 [Marinobacter vulgaris]TSJ66691.1 hypothetical protein FPC41_17130 [Marinobacter vulgaris]
MADKIKLLLHVGFPKTGTTAIQSYFSVNREIFKGGGALYPKSGDTSYSGQAGLALAAKKQLSRPFEMLAKEVLNSGCDTIVISSEYFFMLEEDAINFLSQSLTDYEVKVIAYFRRQDARIESGYLQVLRDSEFRFSGSIENYMSFLEKFPRRTDYYRFIVPWARAFGRSAISIGIYDEVKPKLIDDFLTRCGLKQPAAAVIASTDANVAYKPMVNRFLRRINRISMTPRIHSQITRMLNFLTRKVVGPGTVKEHNLLTQEQREAIVERYAESNAKLAKEFLNREDGVLFK